MNSAEHAAVTKTARDFQMVGFLMNIVNKPDYLLVNKINDGGSPGVQVHLPLHQQNSGGRQVAVRPLN